MPQNLSTSHSEVGSRLNLLTGFPLWGELTQRQSIQANHIEEIQYMNLVMVEISVRGESMSRSKTFITKYIVDAQKFLEVLFKLSSSYLQRKMAHLCNTQVT